jgi:hypothetical protein
MVEPVHGGEFGGKRRNFKIQISKFRATERQENIQKRNGD